MKRPSLNNHTKWLLFPILLVGLNPLLAQELSRWYKMDTQVTPEKGWCVYSSRSLSPSDSSYLDWKSIPADLSNIQVSYITLAGSDLDTTHQFRARVYGIRAQQNEQEVFLIDHDLDWHFDDEKLIKLPELALDENIPYNALYQYPTDLNFNFEMEYDYLVDQKIHSKTSNHGFSIFSKYDTTSKQLYYLDKFKLCFNQRLVYKGQLDGLPVEISSYDFLPWVSTLRFKIKMGETVKEVGIKDVFTIQAEGKQFRLDSVDFVNNKVLISRVSLVEKLNLEAEALFGDATETTKSESKDWRVVHVWGSWCVPCIKNMPKLVQLEKDIDAIELIGICVDNNRESGQKAAAKNGINWRK